MARRRRTAMILAEDGYNIIGKALKNNEELIKDEQKEIKFDKKYQILSKNTALFAEMISEESQQHCTMLITCHTLVDNKENLKKNKRALVSDDGIILSGTEINITDGESVFDATKRICTERKIPFEFTLTPVYNTAYVEGIYNLYEFDCGSGSGWIYLVNGKIQSVGCSDCKLNDGDIVEWAYTCDLGHDIEASLRENE